MKKFIYPDHYQILDKDISKMKELAKKERLSIITTEKDYFRIENKNIKKIKYIKSNLRIVDEEKLIKSII